MVEEEQKADQDRVEQQQPKPEEDTVKEQHAFILSTSIRNISNTS